MRALPLEHQVSSFKSSKELRDLGVKRETLYSYNGNGRLMLESYFIEFSGERWATAHTASDIFQELPDVIEKDGEKYVLLIAKPMNEPQVRYQHSKDGSVKVIKKTGETLAEACAEMWIHLLKEGIVNP